MPDNDIFSYARNTNKAKILSTHDPILFNVREFPPVSGLPAGKVRIKLRADESAPVIYVRNAEGIRAFLINIDADKKLSRGPEIAATWRGGPTSYPVVEVQTGASQTAAAAEAQRVANQTGTKWVYFSDDAGVWHTKPADILHAVILNDVELAGEIVVLRRPSRKEVYHLVWPELSPAPDPAKVPS